MNGNRYGHGDFYTGYWDTDHSTNNKRFGGRILFEFQLSPVNAGKLLNFDVTRQRKTRTGTNNYYVDTDFVPSTMNLDFPNDPSENKDNELPNDDSDGKDEDNIPNLSFIYSADPPAILKKTALTYDDDDILDMDLAAFIVSRNSFREFVRVQVKPTGFPANHAQLLGSRASDLTEWHCSYYTKRSTNEILSGDNDIVSASIPLKFNNTHNGNGTVAITVGSAAVSDNFFLSYAMDTNEWLLGSALGNGSSGAPATNGTWTVTVNGVTATITPGTVGFEDNFTWVFNTFRTILSTKFNEIDLNPINPTTGF